ncbi:MAG: hypothetical protein U0359_01645 [Byssovorax sp.]
MMRWSSLGALVAALALAFPAAAEGDGFVKVIAPGNEKLIAEMLGTGESLPGGCKLASASIDRTQVVAHYDCGRDVVVELHHPSDAKSAPSRTSRFALVPKGDPPADLMSALAERIKAREERFRWISAESPGLASVGDTPVAPSTDQPSGFTPEQSERFVAGVKLFREAKYQEAFELFHELAKTVPDHGVMGMVVASLASTAPERSTVDKLAAEADAKPDDMLAQFVAGVAAHYCGHLRAPTREAKAELYRMTIKYLTRARPRFDGEPRLYVYLGVSNFRLGNQAEAEKLIEQAIPLATNDPDVYYCRAEIFQRVNLKRSIEDIQKYLAMIDKLHAQGVPINDAKQDRVKRMLESLTAVSQGKMPAPPDDELFDPLPSTPPAPEAQPRQAFTDPRMFALGALGAAAAGALAMRLLRRSKKA